MIGLDDSWLGELKKSCIDNDIIALNFKYLQGKNNPFVEPDPNTDPFEHLLYGLDDNHRRNDERLRDKFLKKYQHLESGGWWCSGYNVLTDKHSTWGCFKPNNPRTNEKGKPIKYEHPPNVPTEIFSLYVPDSILESTAKRLNFIGDTKAYLHYWEWVLRNPQVPLIVTEGAKKAGCLLSHNYPAIALPGINNGYRTQDGIKGLIPQLEKFAVKGREIIICFDSDQKFSTRQNVQSAIKTYQSLFRDLGVIVSVMSWHPELGKGIDDVVCNEDGQDLLSALYRERQSFQDWIISQTTPKKPLRYEQLYNFVETEIASDLSFDALRSRLLYKDQEIDFDLDPKAWFYREFGYIAGRKDIEGIVTDFCKLKEFNPIQIYLNKIFKEAKRVPIDNLSRRYFGTDNPFYDEMVKRWLVSAVARAYQPGCQADSVLVLQGTQGGKKTSFFRILGGEFADSSLNAENLTEKDNLLKVHSAWIQEIGELETLNKKEQGIIKNWLTITKDNFRNHYGRKSKDHFRPCVFGGTVNKDEFLQDETGSRRFWVIPLNEANLPGGKIDLVTLEKERDGLWAAAIDLYRSGCQWWFDRKEEKQLEQLNDRFKEFDDWTPIIEAYLIDNQLDWITTGDILDKIFQIIPSQQDKGLQMRVGKIMNRLGWVRSTQGRGRGRGWKPATFPQGDPPLGGDPPSNGGVIHLAEKVDHPQIPLPEPIVGGGDPPDPPFSVLKESGSHQGENSEDDPQRGPRFKEGDSVKYENLITGEWRSSKVQDVYTDVQGYRYYLADGCSRWENQLRIP